LKLLLFDQGLPNQILPRRFEYKRSFSTFTENKTNETYQACVWTAENEGWGSSSSAIKFVPYRHRSCANTIYSWSSMKR